MNVYHISEIPADIKCIISVILNENGREEAIASNNDEIRRSLINRFLKTQGDNIFHFNESGQVELFIYLRNENLFQDSVKSIRAVLLKQRTILQDKIAGRVFGDSKAVVVNAFANLTMAAIQSTNNLGLLKQGKNGATEIESIYLIHNEDVSISTAVTVSKEIAEVQLQAMQLVNLPANHKTPVMIADRVVDSAKQYNYSVKVWDKQALVNEKFGALLSVSEGSKAEPRFLILEYPGISSTQQKTIGLVGKGVTFDTGGISIKPSNNLYLMKSDMAGAAAMLSFVELAARLQLQSRVIAAIPLTENCVDGGSTKPGDVITSYSGKTIEVIDTDAEGRLILADALAYLTKNYATDFLIDMATLTGSVIHALGNHAAGLFSKNDELAIQLQEAGMNSSERCWRLPAWNVYLDEMKSELADIRNLSARQGAGSITAAMFLSEFVNDHSAWAHLDIAGMAFGENEYGSSRSATAYGIRLLYEFVIKNCE